MIRPHFALVLAALLLAPPGPGSAQNAWGTVPVGAEECAARLAEASAESASPLRLADVCGELADEIEAGAWGVALAMTSAEDLAARPFEELLDLVDHYEHASIDTASLVSDDLAEVVESLGPFEPLAELSLWDRIERWIEARLGLDEANSDGGLIDWLRNISIPETWTRTIVYVLGISIVIAALLVAANELRVGGLLRGGGSARVRRRADAAGASAATRSLTFEDLRRAPAASQPVLLLTLLVERLRFRFGDSVRDSLTHRELAAAAGSLGVTRRGELDAVIAAAERVTFAGWRPERSDVEPVLSQGRAVLDELESGEASPRRQGGDEG